MNFSDPFFLDLVVNLSDYFSKEISKEVIFKFKSREKIRIRDLAWENHKESYIQLFSCLSDYRAATLFSHDFLTHFSVLLLGLKSMDAGMENLNLVESFSAWLINKRLMSFFDQQNIPLKRTALVSSSAHLFNFSDHESIELLTFQVFHGAKNMGAFLFLMSQDPNLGGGQ